MPDPLKMNWDKIFCDEKTCVKTNCDKKNLWLNKCWGKKFGIKIAMGKNWWEKIYDKTNSCEGQNCDKKVCEKYIGWKCNSIKNLWWKNGNENILQKIVNKQNCDFIH